MSETPGSIEGSEILVTSQNIVIPKGRPIKKPSLGSTLLFTLSTKIRGRGEIIKEYDPKCHKYNHESMLDNGDAVAGQQLWGFSSFPLGPGSVKKGGRGKTAGHTGQECTLKKMCYLTIVHGWRGDALSEHPSKAQLPNN